VIGSRRSPAGRKVQSFQATNLNPSAMVLLRVLAISFLLPVTAESNSYQNYISQYAGDYLKKFGSKSSGYDDLIHLLWSSWKLESFAPSWAKHPALVFQEPPKSSIPTFTG